MSSRLAGYFVRLSSSFARHQVFAPLAHWNVAEVFAVLAVFGFGIWTQRWVLDLPLTAIDTMPTLAAAHIDSWTGLLDVLVRELRGGITDHYYYRPLTLLSYTLDQLVWGGTTWGYHFTDVVLHALAAVAVFGLARIAVNLSRPGSLVVAALFLLHPATVEIVPAIARRQEPLLVIGFCLAIMGARRVPERIGWLLMVLGSLIAVSSVERGLSVPILVFSYLVLCRFAGTGLRERLILSIWWTMPSLVVALGFFGLRWMLYGSAGAWFRLVHFIQIPAQFGLWLVYPQQVFDLAAPQGMVDRTLFLAAALFLLVVFGYPVLRAPRRTVLWCGLGWIVSYVLLLSYAGILNPWYVYTAVPGLALIIVFYATEARRLILESHGIGIQAGLAGLAAVILTSTLVVSSPVFRDYPAWRVSGELSERFLGELTRLSTDLPAGEPLVVINLPSHFRESDTDYLVTRSAAILWPSSVEAWRNEQADPPEILLVGSADFVGEVGIPEIEFIGESVRVYFADGESSYTDANDDWPGAERLPVSMGRGYSFPWPGGVSPERVFVFDGERLVPMKN